MKNIPLGISILFIVVGLFIFLKMQSDFMKLVGGIFVALGLGMFVSISRKRSRK